MRDNLLEPRILCKFLNKMRSGKRLRVPLADLWKAYHTVYGDHAVGVDARAELAAVLRKLQEDGSCRLPASGGKCWDRASQVALPHWIELPDSGEEREFSWRQYPWRPELAWASQLTSLPQDHLVFLHAVQRGLVEGWFTVRAPLKYRSLQLTGDEKRLEAYLGSQLFAEGRLSLEVLNCDGPWLPLAWERVSDNPRLIIFENAGSFLVAWRVLKKIANPPFGMVAYGGGFQVLRTIPYLAQMPPPEVIHYVGDLDAEGVSIGALFARQVGEAKVTAVVPATEVHAAMFHAAAELGKPTGWPARGKSRSMNDGLWLAPEIVDRIRQIIERGNRIPEEVLHDGHLLDLWRRMEFVSGAEC